MKKHPLKIIGLVFAAVACLEALILLVLLLTLKDRTALAIAGGILALQCLVFGGIGFGFLRHIQKRDQLRESLVSNGYSITAEVTETQCVYSVRINGRHPYRVLCRSCGESRPRTFRSEMYLKDPGLLPGDSVTVYFDPQDDTRYYVDVENAAFSLIHHT